MARTEPERWETGCGRDWYDDWSLVPKTGGVTSVGIMPVREDRITDADLDAVAAELEAWVNWAFANSYEGYGLGDSEGAALAVCEALLQGGQRTTTNAGWTRFGEDPDEGA